MVWRTGVYVVVLLVLSAGTACAAEVLKCETQTVAWNWRAYRCPLTASGSEQHLRFKADFSGGHDDTRASITLTLGEAPVACKQGSKTSLFGEDGDVSLECHFVLDGTAGTQKVLGAVVQFSHAEFVDVELSVLPPTEN